VASARQGIEAEQLMWGNDLRVTVEEAQAAVQPFESRVPQRPLPIAPIGRTDAMEAERQQAAPRWQASQNGTRAAS